MYSQLDKPWKPASKSNSQNLNLISFCKLFFVLIVFWSAIYLATFVSHQQLQNTEKSILNLAIPSGAIFLPQSEILLKDGISEDSKRFMRELNLTNPGDLGLNVDIDENLLTDEHRKIKSQLFDEFGSEVFVSNMISLNRRIKDIRSDYCKQQVYSKDLPKVSVVIAFYNEPRSVLMRLVHSILINTPEHLLEEIVLSDDYSDKEELQRPLEDYLLTLKKVKLVRSHARLGVVGARVLGFKNARGPVMVSLDSHMEVAVGWLEPMLHRLKDNPTLVTFSPVQLYSGETFAMEYSNWVGIGGFLMNMDFDYMDIRLYEPEIHDESPHKSPTLSGPCFAAWGKFLEHIGYIDVDFDIWGGDDVEISFKAWMCGGSIELIPCSKVYHLRREHRYSHDSSGKGGYKWNTDRIVESWLDDNYKKYYYRLVGDTKTRNYGDISKNLALKEKIGCKNFTWYIENVHPKLEIPPEIRDENWKENSTTIKSENEIED